MKPKVLAIIAQKGGTGKSTIAVHLAAYANTKKLHPVILDLDPQGSAHEWNQGRPNSRRPTRKFQF